MNATTVGIDLAKNCFQLAVADEQCAMNLVRGMMREYGIDVPVGIQRGKVACREAS